MEIKAITNIYAVHVITRGRLTGVDGWWVYGIQVGKHSEITWFTQNAIGKLVELLEIARDDVLEKEEMN